MTDLSVAEDKPATPEQVADDPELLELMLQDRRSAPEVYHPTNFWAVYEDSLLPELEEFGLHNFRSRKLSRFSRPVLSSLGATDIAPSPAQIDVFYSRLFHNRYTRRLLPLGTFISTVNRVLNSILPITVPYGANIPQLRQMAYEFARMHGEQAGARPIKLVSSSMIGNPDDVFEINGQMYTMPTIDFYNRYAYCCNHLTFDDTKMMVELGSGSGKQVELIKQLHPHLCFYLFDLPPQLYVCEQYLKALFPDSVISYRETRDMESLPEAQEGKIFIFGNCKFPLLEGTSIDLVWSAHSLQEMEPDVAANYLRYINDCAVSINLRQSTEGQRVAKAKGHAGVLEQTNFAHYQKGLTNFQLVDFRPARGTIGVEAGYSDSFWRRGRS